MIPADLAEWLAKLPRVERIRLLGTLTDRGTIGELARLRRADIAAEIAQRGHGGRKSLAAELGIVRPSTLSEAVRQHLRETIATRD